MKEVRIPFKGWDLVAWLNEHDGDHLVAVKPIAEAIGLDWKTQHRKLANDHKFRCGHMTIPSAGGPQEMLCLPVRQLNGWLYGINANKVKPELREKLLAFQEECHVVLHDGLSGAANREVVDVLMKLISELQMMVRHLTEQNAELTRRVQQHDRMLGIEASAAGKRLSAARHLKVVNH